MVYTFLLLFLHYNKMVSFLLNALCFVLWIKIEKCKKNLSSGDLVT